MTCSRIYSKTTSYFHCAIICILVPCAFQFSYANKCVVFLITMESQILSTISHIKNISKKRPTNRRTLSNQNKKGATTWDERTVKEVLCFLRAKNLLNSNNIAELEENGIPNLPTADVVHIKPVELDKDIQPSNLNSQQALQGIISNSLTPARTRLPPLFSFYTLTPARIINTERDPLCSPQLINLANSQLTQLQNKFGGNIMAMQSFGS